MKENRKRIGHPNVVLKVRKEKLENVDFLYSSKIGISYPYLVYV